MVSTRRSSQREGDGPTTSSQLSHPPSHSQDDGVSSGRPSTRRVATRSAAKQSVQVITLSEIAEEPDAASSKPCPAEAVSAAAVQPADVDAQHSTQSAPLSTGQPPQQLHRLAHATISQALASDGWDSSSDDSGSEGAADNILGNHFMAKLASSLRSAFQARGGETQHDQLASSHPTGAAAHGSAGDTAGPQPREHHLKWRPEVPVPQLKGSERVVHQRHFTGDKEKHLAKQLLAPPRDPHLAAKAAARAPGAAAPSKWYQLPATAITDDVKRELRLLRLRGAYDPKRFYKNFDETKFPKHFQIATVQESPLDFYGGRLAGRQQGATLTEELLKDANISYTRKRRYTKLQEEAHKHVRVKRRKTDLARTNKKKPRPKH